MKQKHLKVQSCRQWTETASHWLESWNFVLRGRRYNRTHAHEGLARHTLQEWGMLSVPGKPVSCQFAKNRDQECLQTLWAFAVLFAHFPWLALQPQFSLLELCLRTSSIPGTTLHGACQCRSKYKISLFLLLPQSGLALHAWLQARNSMRAH